MSFRFDSYIVLILKLLRSYYNEENVIPGLMLPLYHFLGIRFFT